MGHGLPFGAFRYSTPVATVDANSYPRVWAASTDGRVYSFDGDGNQVYAVYDSSGAYNGVTGADNIFYSTPNIYSPIQSSRPLTAPMAALSLCTCILGI